MIDIEEQISNNFNVRFTSRFPGMAERIVMEAMPDASNDAQQEAIETYTEFLELVWQMAGRTDNEEIEC